MVRGIVSRQWRRNHHANCCMKERPIALNEENWMIQIVILWLLIQILILWLLIQRLCWLFFMIVRGSKGNNKAGSNGTNKVLFLSERPPRVLYRNNGFTVSWLNLIAETPNSMNEAARHAWTTKGIGSGVYWYDLGNIEVLASKLSHLDGRKVPSFCFCDIVRNGGDENNVN